MDRCVIEVADLQAGLLLRSGRGYVFHAALPEAFPLDGRTFARVPDAVQAVGELLGGRRRKGGKDL